MGDAEDYLPEEEDECDEEFDPTMNNGKDKV